MGWVTILMALIEFAPKAIQVGMDVQKVVERIVESIRTKKEPTAEDWAIIDEAKAKYSAVIDKPVPEDGPFVDANDR